MLCELSILGSYLNSSAVSSALLLRPSFCLFGSVTTFHRKQDWPLPRQPYKKFFLEVLVTEFCVFARDIF